MLRLWPETIHIFLFPGAAWVCRNGVTGAPVLSAPQRDPAALLDQLRTLLDSQAGDWRAGCHIALTVSDDAASIAALPWQPALQRAAEIDSYARACFEQSGATLDNTWPMHAQFRDFGAMGLAYAFPHAWVTALAAELAQRTFALKSVLPLSGSIFIGARPPAGDGLAVILTQEPYRHAALVFGAGGLLGYDMEMNIGSAAQTAQRLRGRLAAQFGTLARQATWIVDADKPGSQPWQTIA